MIRTNSNRKPKRYNQVFNRNLLPTAGQYYKSQDLKLTGGLEWKSALCPFHNDTIPSLRVRLDSGGFRCMACGVHGGDVLEFHRKRYNLSFFEAARALNALEVNHDYHQ